MVGSDEVRERVETSPHKQKEKQNTKKQKTNQLCKARWPPPSRPMSAAAAF